MELAKCKVVCPFKMQIQRVIIRWKTECTFSLKFVPLGSSGLSTGNICTAQYKDKFPGAAEFNQLMVNSENKVRLQKLLKEHLIEQVCRVQGDVIYCEGEMSTNLTTGMASRDYVFKHPEADTIMLSAYAKLRNGGYTGPVVLDCEDTDVYVQAAYVSQKVTGDLLIKRKHVLINSRAMLSKEVADIIIPLHVITGSDHISGFYGHRKKKVLAKVVSDPEARKLLRRVGENLQLEEDVRADMKSFVLSIV